MDTVSIPRDYVLQGFRCNYRTANI